MLIDTKSVISINVKQHFINHSCSGDVYMGLGNDISKIFLDNISMLKFLLFFDEWMLFAGFYFHL